MTELLTQLDPLFIQVVMSLAINVLTQIGKPFHTSPKQVFNVIAITICIIYGLIEVLGGHDALLTIGVKAGQVVLVASGFWHLFMRPEGPVMQWWNKRK